MDDEVIISEEIFDELVISENPTYEFSAIKNVTEIWGKSQEIDRYYDTLNVIINSDSIIIDLSLSHYACKEYGTHNDNYVYTSEIVGFTMPKLKTELDISDYTVWQTYNTVHAVVKGECTFSNGYNANELKINNPDGALDLYVKKIIAENTNNNLYKLKWCAIGDSITAYGNQADLSGYVYTNLIANKNSMSLTNLADGGRTTKEAIIAIEGMTGYDHDIVTCMIGTNDRLGSTQEEFDTWLGGIDDEPQADGETFYSQFKYLCELLLTKYPHQRIGIITPMHGNTMFNSTTFQQENKNIGIADAEKEICRHYGIKCFDTIAEMSVLAFDSELMSTILSDGLHPSEFGNQIMARKIEQWMKTL